MQPGCDQDSSETDCESASDLAVVCEGGKMTIINYPYDFPLDAFLADLAELGITTSKVGLSPCG